MDMAHAVNYKDARDTDFGSTYRIFVKKKNKRKRKERVGSVSGAFVWHWEMG